jgi:MoxR-like ATPase
MEHHENDHNDDAYTDVIANPAPEWLRLELPHRVPSHWLAPILDFMCIAVAILEPDPPLSAILQVRLGHKCLLFSVQLDPRLNRLKDVRVLLTAANAYGHLSAQIASAHRSATSGDVGVNADVDEQNPLGEGWSPAPLQPQSQCKTPRKNVPLRNSSTISNVSIFKWKIASQKDGGREIGRDADSAKRMLSTILELKKTGPTRPLHPPPSDWRDRVDDMLAKFPNFASVIRIIVRPHLAMLEKNASHRHSPVLLVGAPGIGKTYFAQALAHTLGLADAMFISMAGETNGSALGGSSIFWANSSPGKLFEALAWGENHTLPPANPLVVLDEIDKVDIERYNPLGSLYSLLEEETAETFRDQSLPDVVIDARHVRFIATANDVAKIPEPLLSRMMVFHIDPPSPDQLRRVILTIYQGLIERLQVCMHHVLPEEVVQAALTLSPREAKVRIECAIATAISEDRDYVQISDWPDVPTASQQTKRRSIGFTA